MKRPIIKNVDPIMGQAYLEIKKGNFKTLIKQIYSEKDLETLGGLINADSNKETLVFSLINYICQETAT